MKIPIFLICLLETFLLCGSAVCSRGQSVPAQITKQYASVEKAYQNKDIDGILSHLAPNFTYQGQNTTAMGKDRVKQSLIKQLEFVASVRSAKFDIIKSSMKNGAAIVTVKLTAEMLRKSSTKAHSHSVEDFDKRFTSGGKKNNVAINVSAIQTDTWQKNSHGWQIVHTDAVSQAASGNTKTTR